MNTNTEPCYDCERPVRMDRPHWMTNVVDGVLADGTPNDLGWYPIGPECRKSHPEAKRWAGRA